MSQVVHTSDLAQEMCKESCGKVGGNREGIKHNNPQHKGQKHSLLWLMKIKMGVETKTKELGHFAVPLIGQMHTHVTGQ